MAFEGFFEQPLFSAFTVQLHPTVFAQKKSLGNDACRFIDVGNKNIKGRVRYNWTIGVKYSFSDEFKMSYQVLRKQKGVFEIKFCTSESKYSHIDMVGTWHPKLNTFRVVSIEASTKDSIFIDEQGILDFFFSSPPSIIV